MHGGQPSCGYGATSSHQPGVGIFCGTMHNPTPPPLLQRRAGNSCARVFSATKPSLIFLAIPIYIVKTARFEQGFARGPLERPLRGAVSCLL